MKDLLTFVVEGMPIPKGRPRVFQVKGEIRTMTPKATTAYQELVSLRARAAAARARWKKAKVDRYAVMIEAYGVDPRSDLDNVAKAILDACNEEVWHDDRQVDYLVISRHGVETKAHARVEVARIGAHRDDVPVWVPSRLTDMSWEKP